MAKSKTNKTKTTNKTNNNNASTNNSMKLKRHEAMQLELKELQERIASETPACGYTPPLHQQVSFRSLPLSQATLRGLEMAKYTITTDIQNACLPHALAGRDILGAAQTGSGKTLAFIIPVLERLYAQGYSPQMGCGAIVLSPTRELATQIFSVTKKVGQYHKLLTAGLVVGGKKEFRLEQDHIARTNILICTPGRLLQHLEQTPDLDVSNTQVLVLDEADRILDMGFRTQMTRILEYLPTSTERQTMLFSATQTRKVADLAALSLVSPEYLGVHDDESSSTTPIALKQSMVVVPLHHKLDAIYSFIKSHLKSKTIIFLASCSQVRHAWELFCALQPGIPIMALHGKLVQTKRNQVYQQFVQRPHAVLFATDVAARGLDVPHVHWVVQGDAPEDVAMYVHRVGRTARYKAGGKALLMLTPQEEELWKEQLLNNKKSKIPITTVSINPNKTLLVTQKATALVTSRPGLKELAKKAFKSYVRSVHLLPSSSSSVPVYELPLAEFAAALGLPSTPKLGFLKSAPTRDLLREKKNVNHKLDKLKQQIKAEKLAKRLIGETTTESANNNKKKKRERKEDDDDDLMVVKKTHAPNDDNDDDDLPDVDVNQVSAPRRVTKKIRLEGGTGLNTKIRFDKDDDAFTMQAAVAQSSTTTDTLESSHEDYMTKVRARLAATSQVDREEEQERVRAKHLKLRHKMTNKKDTDEQGVVATLASSGSDDSGSDDSGSSSSGDDDSSSGDDDSSSDDGSSDSDDDDDDDAIDIQAQEELALSMIRGGS